MFLIALAIILATVLIFKGVKIFNYIDHVAGIMEMIPGPTPYPFVGNLFQFGLKPDEYPKKILQYCRKYDFQGFRSLALFQYHIMLSDPADIQSMLSSSTLLYKEHLYSFLRPWLGDGLLTSSGARWLKHQKLYLPAFERAAINGYLRVAHRTNEGFMQKLAKIAEADEVFDAQELVAKCTLDIVCENATGLPGHSLDDEPSALHIAVKDLCDVIQQRTFSIIKRFDTLFQLTSYYWKQRQALQLLKNEINSIVVRRRLQLTQRKAKESKDIEQPFLDVLLKAKLDGQALSQQDILEELSTFIFTGHDPMAATISFTLYTLSRHAQIQAKCYAEQQRIWGASATPITSQNNHATIDWARLQQMTYLESVIRETLRLYPAVPLIARTNRQPIDINGTKVAKRTTVIMCLIAMGYNERYFDAPCEFRPERFTHNPTGVGTEAYKSVPFSAGPRRCIAETYAMQQLKVILGNVIRNFELLPPVEGLSTGINDHTRVDCVPQSIYDPILNIRVTLRSENGIQLRIRKRLA